MIFSFTKTSCENRNVLQWKLRWRSKSDRIHDAACTRPKCHSSLPLRWSSPAKAVDLSEIDLHCPDRWRFYPWHLTISSWSAQLRHIRSTLPHRCQDIQRKLSCPMDSSWDSRWAQRMKHFCTSLDSSDNKSMPRDLREREWSKVNDYW